MADDGGNILSGLGKGIGQILPYAIPAVLGAAMGGPMGALAGLGLGVGGTSEDAYRRAQLGMESQRLGMEERRTDAEIGLQKEEHEMAHEDRLAGMAQRYDEFKQRLDETKDQHQWMQTYQQGMLDMRAQGQALTAQMAQAHLALAQLVATNAHDDRTAELQRQYSQMQQQKQENNRARIAGIVSLAQHAKDNSGFKDFLSNFGVAKSGDDIYRETLANGLKSEGFSRDELLNNGIDKGVVDMIYPPAKPLSAKGGSKGGGGKASGTPSVADFLNKHKING